MWQPPEAVSAASGGPAASAPAPAPPSADYVKAKAAADAKDWKKVRALLEKKARAGKATAEEAQLALDACIAAKDKACAEGVHAKYPNLVAH